LEYNPRHHGQEESEAGQQPEEGAAWQQIAK
jgi:hypothetical protein